MRISDWSSDVFSSDLVDPDNRRPVDFIARHSALSATTDDDELLRDWRNGRIKQRLIARLLGLRAEFPEIFALGRYVPLSVRGARAAHVIAFARQYGDIRVIIMAPRAPQEIGRESWRERVCREGEITVVAVSVK